VASTLDIVDPQTGTQVLWSFNDQNGTAAWAAEYGGVKTAFGVGGGFALNTPDVETVMFDRSTRDGSLALRKRARVSTSSVRVRLYGASTVDYLIVAAGRLQQLMENGGVMKWTPNNATSARYIDYLPSQAPALLVGADFELNYLTNYLDTPEGVLITFQRQPYLRGGELDSTVNVLENATLLMDTNQDGVPGGWTSAAGTHTIVATDDAYQNSHTAAANLITQNYTTTTNTSYTVSADVRRISGSGAGGIRVSSVGGTGSADSPNVTSAAWTRVSATVTTSGATTAIQVALRQASASGTTVLQFRNVQLEAGSAASAFRVGVFAGSINPLTAGKGRTFPVYVNGTARTPARIQVQPSALSVFKPIHYGTTARGPVPGSGSFSSWLNAAAGGTFQLSTWVVGSDTAAISDTALSGGNGLQTTFAGTAAMALRARFTIADAGILNALRGRSWRVLVRARPTTTGTFQVQFDHKWGSDLGSTSIGSRMAPVSWTWSNNTTVAAEVDLGVVRFPDTPAINAGIGIEAGRVSGTGFINWDFVQFIPADRYSAVSRSVLATSNTDWFETDADAGLVRTVVGGTNSALGVSTTRSVVDVVGPVPIVLEPGLNLLTVIPTVGPSTGSHGVDTITDTFTVRTFYSPRWHM